MNAFEWQLIAQYIQNHTGITTTAAQQPLVKRRLDAFMSRHALTPTRLCQQLSKLSTPDWLDELIECFTIHESLFFRHSNSFEKLKEHLIPEVIAQRFMHKNLRIWSAACADGQEAYSIALLLADSFPELRSWSIQILGTDLSPHCIQKAQQGIYSEFEIKRGTPPALLDRYGRTIASNQWCFDLPPHIQLEFSVLNLSKPFFHPAAFDLILLRNVLIYFEPQVQRAVLSKINLFMRPVSALVLGPTESGEAVFKPHRIDDFTYYRQASFS